LSVVNQSRNQAPDGSGCNQLEQPEVFLLVVKAQQWYTASSRN
jgi:hypothetical protein